MDDAPAPSPALSSARTLRGHRGWVPRWGVAVCAGGHTHARGRFLFRPAQVSPPVVLSCASVLGWVSPARPLSKNTVAPWSQATNAGVGDVRVAAATTLAVTIPAKTCGSAPRHNVRRTWRRRIRRAQPRRHGPTRTTAMHSSGASRRPHDSWVALGVRHVVPSAAMRTAGHPATPQPPPAAELPSWAGKARPVGGCRRRRPGGVSPAAPFAAASPARRRRNCLAGRWRRWDGAGVGDAGVGGAARGGVRGGHGRRSGDGPGPGFPPRPLLLDGVVAAAAAAADHWAGAAALPGVLPHPRR